MHRFFHVSNYVAYAEFLVRKAEKCPIRFDFFIRIYFVIALIRSLQFFPNLASLLRRFVLLQVRVHTWIIWRNFEIVAEL